MQYTKAAHGATSTRGWPGATALAVLVVGDALVCANAGDCRAVLCRNGLVRVTAVLHTAASRGCLLHVLTACIHTWRAQAVPVSRDHTAALEDERQRVDGAGALVRWVVDGWRVGPAGLQVTRCAIGM